MSGFRDQAVRVSPSVGHRRRVVNSSNDRRIRGHARDLSDVVFVFPDGTPSSGRSTPSVPDIDKDLPSIPSTSDHLQPATESFKNTILPVDPPDQSGPPTVPRDLKRTAITDSEEIAAKYLRRCGSREALRNQVVCPPKLQDGSFPCLLRDCADVLPTREAYTCHVHIHLIHDGLTFCQLCGLRFVDDDNKNEHLSSCSKLPAFHEVESFITEQPGRPLPNFLNRLRL